VGPPYLPNITHIDFSCQQQFIVFSLVVFLVVKIDSVVVAVVVFMVIVAPINPHYLFGIDSFIVRGVTTLHHNQYYSNIVFRNCSRRESLSMLDITVVTFHVWKTCFLLQMFTPISSYDVQN
jgi:hypothetical protein